MIEDIDVLEIVNEMKKKHIDEIHKNKITPPKTAKSRWSTWAKPEDCSKRIKVVASTEQKLYDKLFDLYFVKVIPTIEEVFPEFLENKTRKNRSPRTIKRYQQYWNKYYDSREIVTTKVSKITPSMIEDFYHDAIGEFNLTKKELGNMKVIIKESLEICARKDLISVNPFDKVKIDTNGCYPEGNPSPAKQIYLPDEKEKLFAELNKRDKRYSRFLSSVRNILAIHAGIASW